MSAPVMADSRQPAPGLAQGMQLLRLAADNSLLSLSQARRRIYRRGRGGSPRDEEIRSKVQRFYSPVIAHGKAESALPPPLLCVFGGLGGELFLVGTDDQPFPIEASRGLRQEREEKQTDHQRSQFTWPRRGCLSGSK